MPATHTKLIGAVVLLATLLCCTGCPGSGYGYGMEDLQVAAATPRRFHLFVNEVKHGEGGPVEYQFLQALLDLDRQAPRLAPGCAGAVEQVIVAGPDRALAIVSGRRQFSARWIEGDRCRWLTQAEGLVLPDGVDKAFKNRGGWIGWSPAEGIVHLLLTQSYLAPSLWLFEVEAGHVVRATEVPAPANEGNPMLIDASAVPPLGLFRGPKGEEHFVGELVCDDGCRWSLLRDTVLPTNIQPGRGAKLLRSAQGRPVLLGVFPTEGRTQGTYPVLTPEWVHQLSRGDRLGRIHAAARVNEGFVLARALPDVDQGVVELVLFDEDALVDRRTITVAPTTLYEERLVVTDDPATGEVIHLFAVTGGAIEHVAYTVANGEQRRTRIERALRR